MFGQPKTRKDIQEETGLKGKDLTLHIRTILAGGVTSGGWFMSSRSPAISA